MRCHPAGTAVLALAALLGLWAGPGQAASLAVVAEGDGVYAYELALEPGEVVAGIQLDLLVGSASVAVLETGWAVPVTLGDAQIVTPWNLTSTVREVLDGNIRLAHTFDQAGRPVAGLSAGYLTSLDGSQTTFLEFIEQQLGAVPIDPFVQPGCFPPPTIPVARLLVEQGPAPTRYTAGVCVPAAGATCSFPETNVPEPVVPLLLAPLGLVLVTRRNTAE